MLTKSFIGVQFVAGKLGSPANDLKEIKDEQNSGHSDSEMDDAGDLDQTPEDHQRIDPQPTPFLHQRRRVSDESVATSRDATAPAHAPSVPDRDATNRRDDTPGYTRDGAKMLAHCTRICGPNAQKKKPGSILGRLFIVRPDSRSRLCEIRSATDLGRRVVEAYLDQEDLVDFGDREQGGPSDARYYEKILLIASSHKGDNHIECYVQFTKYDGVIGYTWKKWLNRGRMNAMLGASDAAMDMEEIYKEEGVTPPWKMTPKRRSTRRSKKSSVGDATEADKSSKGVTERERPTTTKKVRWADAKISDSYNYPPPRPSADLASLQNQIQMLVALLLSQQKAAQHDPSRTAYADVKLDPRSLPEKSRHGSNNKRIYRQGDAENRLGAGYC